MTRRSAAIGTFLAVSCVMASACADTSADVALAVTLKDGAPQVIVVTCGAPPSRIAVAQWEADKIWIGRDPQIDNVPISNFVARATSDDLTDAGTTLPLDVQMTGGESPRGLIVYVEQSGFMSRSHRSIVIPDEIAWPEYPQALGGAPNFARPVKLGTDNSDLC